MKAYKFRSSAQMAFVFDILFNKRLYCSDWTKLNDPMEGMFQFLYKEGDKLRFHHQLLGIRESKQRFKICSLSETYDCHLLWAHYANGFDGVAIEVELPDNASNIRRVQDRDVFFYIDPEKYTDEFDIAQKILFSKYREWAYEKEIRILNESEWYPLESPVKQVIVGHRLNPALLEALKIICAELNIKLCKAEIEADGIKPKEIPLNRSISLT